MLNQNNPFYKYLTYEDKEHARVVEFMKQKYPEVVFFHIPNEGKKSAFERYKHSIMGALEGCPDFVFLHPKSIGERLIYHGLLIELKAPEHNRIVLKGKKAGTIVKAKGKLSPEQAVLIEKINKSNYKAVCCFGYDESIEVIKKYLND
jgi:hypothetical protein